MEASIKNSNVLRTAGESTRSIREPISKMRITNSGWSASGGLSPLSLLKSGKCLILVFSGKPANPP